MILGTESRHAELLWSSLLHINWTMSGARWLDMI